MNAMKKTILYTLFAFAIWSCESLDVENLNNPNQQQVYSNSRDLKKLVLSVYNSYWRATHDINLCSASLIAADQFTASWKNFGWMDASLEPRIAYNNLVTYDNSYVSENLFKGLSTVLTSYINPTLELIHGGKKIGQGGKENASILALCYFLQGASLGQLGLTYDKAMIVLDSIQSDTVNFSRYPLVINAAVRSLEKAISICDTATFQLDASVVPGTRLTNINLKQICHSYIARFLVLASRTAGENDEVDWEKVIANTNEGITEDFGPMGDAPNLKEGTWYDDNFYYLTNPSNGVYAYAFVDSRIIHLMDGLYPTHFPKVGMPVVHPGLRIGEAQSPDQRLTTDFKYFSSCGMYADRGYYHFSHYQFIRYDYIRTEGIGPLIDMRQYENELLKAEAYAMRKNQPKIDSAVAILNDANNPRIARGGLPILGTKTNKETVLDAIFYEREIELLGQGYMVGFCDMRRRDKLQRGTPLHYPIPGLELETLHLDNYTFGGQNGADGKDASSGGWEPKDGWNDQ
jgi:starch-binding outer membrane protein, SusD/RagB family